MPKFPAVSAIVAALLLAYPDPAVAQTDSTESGHWVVGLGAYNINESGDADTEADLHAEYRIGFRVLNFVRPFVAADLTSEGSVWGGAGLAAEIPLGERFFAVASFAPGLYSQGGSDLDLDSSLIFRSQAEFGYRFDAGSRLSLAFSHMSNAGSGDRNPGVEMIAVYYYVPF